MSTALSPTGVEGLDNILGGGFPSNCVYLVEGNPGVGKTTLAMQFLLEGVRRGEATLYVTLSETRTELALVAASHGWNLDGITIIELSAVDGILGARSGAPLYNPSEVELTQLSKLFRSEIEKSHPKRLVLDSLSEMRLLSQSALRYRRELLNLKQFLTTQDCTALLLDDRTADADGHVHSIVHGALTLDVAPLRYGIFRRSLAVTKLRGVKFREGQHDYVINTGGLQVFPRLVASEHRKKYKRSLASSSNDALDEMLGGGLHFGTSNLLMGPAGSGKSTVAALFASAAAARSEQVEYFIFDETLDTLLERTHALGIDLAPHMASGMVRIHQIDPAEIAPGELAYQVHAAVRAGVKMVVLDSLNGYVSAMPNEDYLTLHLHELLAYLNQQGVMTIMVLAQHGLLGPMGTPVDISYLADTVILTRFFEAAGTLKKAISIIKKRSGPHEDSLREFSMRGGHITVGPPLMHFQGVMTGVPRAIGGVPVRGSAS